MLHCDTTNQDNIIDEVATLIVGDTTNSADQYFNIQASQITIGVDIYDPGNKFRYFNGDLDEIRVGDIPEPMAWIWFMVMITCFFVRE